MTRLEALETLARFDEHLTKRIANEQRGGNPVHEATARKVREAIRFAVEEMHRMEDLER